MFLIRLLFYYLLFNFIFRGVSFLVRIMLAQRSARNKQETKSRTKQARPKDPVDYGDVVDAEFKEMKDQ